MKWTRDSHRSWISDCKAYRIALYSTQAGEVYALWAVGKVPALWYGELADCKEKANELHREQ